MLKCAPPLSHGFPCGNAQNYLFAIGEFDEVEPRRSIKLQAHLASQSPGSVYHSNPPKLITAKAAAIRFAADARHNWAVAFLAKRQPANSNAARRCGFNDFPVQSQLRYTRDQCQQLLAGHFFRIQPSPTNEIRKSRICGVVTVR